VSLISPKVRAQMYFFFVTSQTLCYIWLRAAFIIGQFDVSNLSAMFSVLTFFKVRHLS
jgi:hypothetical protein